MPRRGENIRKRSDGRWEGRFIERYTSDGKACYKSVYGHTYSEVKDKMKKIKTDTKKNVKLYYLTSYQLCFEWLENKKIMIKQSTYAQYYTLIDKHIIPYFKNIKIDSINNDVINTFIREIYEKGLSVKSVHDITSIILQIIKYGQNKKHIQQFNFDIIKPKLLNKELSILSKSEQEKLVNYIRLDFNSQKIGILLSLYMGLRLGEICALKWSDINFDIETLSITKTIQRIKNTDKNQPNKTNIIIDSPKSAKSVREIPIPSFLLQILKDNKSSLDTYILTGTKKYIEPRLYQTIFKRYLTEAGIQTYNFHTLRHTFATRAIEQDFDIKSLSEILGHSSVKFTLEKYVHPSYEHKKRNMEKLAVCF